MTDELRAAAQALIDRWETPLWKDVPHTAECIHRLRAALTTPAGAAAMPRCLACNYQHGHQIGCINNPVDIALRAGAAAVPASEPPFAVTFAAEYLTAYMQNEPDEVRSKLKTLIDAAFATHPARSAGG